MSNITISFYGDEETKKILDKLPKPKRSQIIRDAITLKHSLDPIADKIDQVICKVSEVKSAIDNLEVKAVPFVQPVQLHNKEEKVDDVIIDEMIADSLLDFM